MVVRGVFVKFAMTQCCQLPNWQAFFDDFFDDLFDDCFDHSFSTLALVASSGALFSTKERICGGEGAWRGKWGSWVMMGDVTCFMNSLSACWLTFNALTNLTQQRAERAVLLLNFASKALASKALAKLSRGTEQERTMHTRLGIQNTQQGSAQHRTRAVNVHEA